MMEVTKHAEGWVISVRARAGAKSNELLDIRDGAIYLCVSAPPEDGKANEAIGVLLAENLGVRKSQVALIAGQTSKRKRFLIRGIDVDELKARVDAALTPTVYDPQDLPPDEDDDE